MKTKKKLLLVLLVLMAFALAACSNNNVSNDAENRPGFNSDNQNPWEKTLNKIRAYVNTVSSNLPRSSKLSIKNLIPASNSIALAIYLLTLFV